MKHNRFFWLPIFLFLAIGCNKESTTKVDLLANMDTTVNPAEDFYRYATGGWLDSHPIPEDESYYDVTIDLQRKVDKQIISIINDLISHKQKPGTVEEKIASLYKSYLDTTKTFSEGLKPIQFLFDSIDNIKSASDIQNGFALLQKYCLTAPIDFWANAMQQDSVPVFTFEIRDGGHIWNELEYYSDTTYIERYKKYIATLFESIGIDYVSARQTAEIVYNIDYELFREAQLSNEQASLEITTFGDICKLTPNIDWDKMFVILEWVKPTVFLTSCGQQYLTHLNKMTESIPAENWKLFFKFWILNDIGTTTSSLSYKEHNDFTMFTQGTEKVEDISDQALDCVNFIYENAIGRLYSEKFCSDETISAIWSMTDNIRHAMHEHIENNNWLTDEAKKQSIKKLDSINIKIGHPKTWQDNSQKVTTNTYLTGLTSNLRIGLKSEFDSIDKPISKYYWYSFPQQANAYYVQFSNSIEIDAAIIQPPFFYPNADDAVIYGMFGTLIAHEVIHGFDNYGKDYDYDGSYHCLWTATDCIEFDKRAQTLIDRFNSFVVIDTMHADGEYTLEENVADLCGLEIAYTAFTKTEQWKDQTRLIDGLTPDQRFFIAYAQSMAGQYRDEAIRNLTLTDEHALSQHRVEGPLPNIDAFIKAFNIKPGDRYYLPDSLRIHIW